RWQTCIGRFWEKWGFQSSVLRTVVDRSISSLVFKSVEWPARYRSRRTPSLQLGVFTLRRAASNDQNYKFWSFSVLEPVGNGDAEPRTAARWLHPRHRK